MGEPLCHLHHHKSSRSFLAVNKDFEVCLRKVDIPPAGVDFHCVPKMVTEASLTEIKCRNHLFQDNNLEHTLSAAFGTFPPGQS